MLSRYPKRPAIHQNNVLGATPFLPQHALFCYIDPLISNAEFLWIFVRRSCNPTGIKEPTHYILQTHLI